MNVDFEKNGYYVARNFFDVSTISLIQTYFNIKYKNLNYNTEKREAAHKAILSNVDKPGGIASGFNFNSDTLIESLLSNHTNRVMEILGLDLLPTFGFARIYEKGDNLLPHIDRLSCEVSATCPIITTDNSPSTIYISNVRFDLNKDKRKYSLEEIEKRGAYTEVNLFPGDVLFYKGCEMFHWRKPLTTDLLIQFFIHFVKAKGRYKDWYLDKRPFLGYN